MLAFMGVDRLLAGALILGVACQGGPPRPPTTPNAARDTVAYAPLQARTDAKTPGRAVILGTDARDGSTVMPLPTATSHASVDALWVRFAREASGGSTAVKLSTTPNADGSVQVGVYEAVSGGTGTQWRAGVWISAFVAATTLGKDLTDFTFSAASSGYIDGASASGLMAGGFLATMLGDRVDPAATMTGTINPDGTIGPVGGIPEKFAGAIAAGKKRLGYPIGMRLSRTLAGKLVDLEQLAREGGARAVEIADVYGAYQLLTGRVLPRPVPVPEADMALDAETVRRLDGKFKEWQRRLADEWSTLLQLQQGGRMPAALVAMARTAQRTAEQAEALHRRGLVGAAYARMLAAWVSAASATDTYDVLVKAQRGDLAAAIATLDQLDQLDRQTTEVLRAVGALAPTTMGGHLRMLGAFQSALRGWGFKLFAGDAVKATRLYLQGLAGRPREALVGADAADEIVARVGPTVLLIGRTFADTKLAQERLEVESEQSITYRCAPETVARLSTSFQSAATAGVQYFDTLLVEPMAKSAGVPMDAARMRVALREPDYLVAYVLSRLDAADGLQALKRAWGETSVGWNLLALAASEQAYFEAAALLAKHYSLKVRTEGGRVTQVAHDKAFANMLASAERTARASARAARIAAGAIPVQARLAYQQARAQRDGDLNDQIEALSGFWASSAYSQTAVMLARN